MKALYDGDNLQVLRDSIATASVDLIYLDPPFNSKATYNVGNQGSSGYSGTAYCTSTCSQEPSFDDKLTTPIERPRSIVAGRSSAYSLLVVHLDHASGNLESAQES